jgi:outer membrane protein
MSIKKIFILSAIAFIFSNVELKAQTFKVAYISTDELLMSLPEVKTANDSLMAEKQRLEKKIQSMANDLRNKAMVLEKKKNDTAPIQYQKEVELLQAEEKKIMEFEQLGQEELKLKSQSFSGPLEERVNAAIKEVSAQEGYNYVINSSQGLVLYADPSTNILEKVKAKLIKK